MKQGLWSESLSSWQKFERAFLRRSPLDSTPAHLNQTGDHMRRNSHNKGSPLARQRAYVLGKGPAPRWAFLEMVIEMFDDHGECEGGLYLEEQRTDHPEQIPLLALRQVDDKAVVCGEVWFFPAQLPELILMLQEQLEINFTSPRRWHGGPPDGPLVNLDMPG
jgi:hypothetical protein